MGIEAKWKSRGIRVGKLPCGPLDKISDVPGVTVGHCTLADGEVQTGVTALLPHQGDIFHDKVMAASHVINGFGKTTGLVQIDELGTLETPILFTNTLSVGTVETALVKYMLDKNPDICETTGSVNPVVCECNDSGLNDIRGLHVTEENVRAALADCRAAGHAPLLCSSYRTQEKQTQLYNNLVQKQIARGNSRSEAMAKAAKEVAVPGTSEHQLGLAVDIVDTQNQVLNRAQEDTAVQQWLMEHCWEYGFILRYPPDKEEKTGIIYEPWHYRYVGREYAQAIRQSGLCLEEFLQR